MDSVRGQRPDGARGVEVTDWLLLVKLISVEVGGGRGA